MARAYCLQSDVEEFLPKNLHPEGTTSPDYANPESDDLSIADIDYFIQMASSRMDAAFRTQYYVPFKKINQGGVVSYPDPIPYMCAVLASQMIYERTLQGTDRAKSESQIKREEEVVAYIRDIQNGELMLDAQKLRGNRFVRAPLYNVPRNPAEGNRSKGDKG